MMYSSTDVRYGFMPQLFTSREGASLDTVEISLYSYWNRI
jgi:hypothetical protein